MKVAIPTDEKGLEGNVAEHFGRAMKFVIVEVGKSGIKVLKTLEGPFVEHSPSELPKLLKEEGVDIVVVAGIGRRAMEEFSKRGIRIMSVSAKSVKEIMKEMIKGMVETGKEMIKAGFESMKP